MAEELVDIAGSKNEVYKSLFPQIVALIGDEKDQTANLANVGAAVYEPHGAVCGRSNYT